MNKKMEKYFDILKYFLKKADSIDDLIEECRLTQVYLGEIIAMKAEAGNKSNQATREYEQEQNKCRDIVYDALRKRGISTTESVVKSKVEFMFGDKLAELKKTRDEAKIEAEVTQALYFAMMQRKDMLVQIIDRWKFKDEYESCLMKNKQIIERLCR